MFFDAMTDSQMLVKKVNFSSATTPGMFQLAVEGELDKRGGKNFGPPGGKSMTFFLDDLSMPEVNTWGDQPTLELVRQLVETKGVCFLDKDKRGDVKTMEDLLFVGAMSHPGGGKNDIPNRAKRHFFIFNMITPSEQAIFAIYGAMLSGAPGTCRRPRSRCWTSSRASPPRRSSSGAGCGPSSCPRRPSSTTSSTSAS